MGGNGNGRNVYRTQKKNKQHTLYYYTIKPYNTFTQNLMIKIKIICIRASNEASSRFF